MTASKIDWRYHRQACETCKKSNAFLEAKGVVILDELDARKNRIGDEAALELLEKVERLLVVKGKGFSEIDLKKNRPEDGDVLKWVMGPTGNLRAPSIRIGKTLAIGFNEEMYRKLFA